MNLILDDANIEAIKKRQSDKLKQEVRYVKDNMLSAMSYLDLSNDERVQELYFKLGHALTEAEKTLKEISD